MFNALRSLSTSLTTALFYDILKENHNGKRDADLSLTSPSLTSLTDTLNVQTIRLAVNGAIFSDLTAMFLVH